MEEGGECGKQFFLRRSFACGLCAHSILCKDGFSFVSCFVNSEIENSYTDIFYIISNFVFFLLYISFVEAGMHLIEIKNKLVSRLFTRL